MYLKSQMPLLNIFLDFQCSYDRQNNGYFKNVPTPPLEIEFAGVTKHFVFIILALVTLLSAQQTSQLLKLETWKLFFIPSL